jgi:hypothetical protein
MKNALYLLIFINVLILSACKEECSYPNDLADQRYYADEIFNDSYIDIYGSWVLTEVTGGIHGSGHDLNFDLL